MVMMIDRVYTLFKQYELMIDGYPDSGDIDYIQHNIWEATGITLSGHTIQTLWITYNREKEKQLCAKIM